jgi:hypothetical protein
MTLWSWHLTWTEGSEQGDNNRARKLQRMNNRVGKVPAEGAACALKKHDTVKILHDSEWLESRV